MCTAYQLHSYVQLPIFNVRLVGLVCLVLPLRDGRLRCYCGGLVDVWMDGTAVCVGFFSIASMYAREQEGAKGVSCVVG